MHNQTDRLPWRQRAPRRALLTLFVLFALMFGATAVSTGVADAPGTTSAASANVPTSYRLMYWGAQYGYADWRDATDYVYISVTPGSLTTNCTITLFDWTRSASWPESSHYDGRVARSCKSNTNKPSGDVWESAGANLIGMQKLGICFGTQFNETSGTCYTEPSSEASVTSVSMAAYCARQWTLYSNGSSSYGSGGNPTDCYS